MIKTYKFNKEKPYESLGDAIEDFYEYEGEMPDEIELSTYNVALLIKETGDYFLPSSWKQPVLIFKGVELTIGYSNSLANTIVLKKYNSDEEKLVNLLKEKFCVQIIENNKICNLYGLDNKLTAKDIAFIRKMLDK